MGVDGNQYIQIRGSEKILDELEANGLKMENLEGQCARIADAFFGPKNVDIRHRDKKYLVIHTHFRNKPIQEYMVELLKKYPTCWFKYDYKTEDGYCGMWIGRIGHVQELEWTELTDEEIVHVEDFSSSKTS